MMETTPQSAAQTAPRNPPVKTYGFARAESQASATLTKRKKFSRRKPVETLSGTIVDESFDEENILIGN